MFDRLAGRYDSWYERNRVIAELEVKAVKAVLPQGYGVEVGVGTGFFASRLGVPLGVDPSIPMLAIARRRRVDVVQGVGERLPLRTCSLDYVLLVVTLCFVDDPQTVLAESARVVRRGGSVVACIVPRDSPWGRRYIELGRRGHPFYSVARFYTVDEVEEMMEEAGLMVVERVGVLSSPPGEPVDPGEEPTPNVEGRGFVCVRAVKP